MALCVVGAQWGDEGKGKVVHYLAADMDLVARYGGGNNAGHTVFAGGRQFKLHLVPSGIFHPTVTCVLGAGMVINPRVLLEELAEFERAGFSTAGLWVSAHAHVVMPYHYWQDEEDEARRGDQRIGTTGRGIGPAYQDKVARRGIRMMDLCDPEIFHQKLVQNLERHDAASRADGRGAVDELHEEYQGYARTLAPRVTDTSLLVHRFLREGKRILFEGAQGTLLDLDFGTYPYVTASHPIAGGVSVGLGIPPYHVTEVLGVLKAYTTRVGNGVFPTELADATGDALREKGKEYGTTTGRPRRCGWLDMVMLRYGARVNGYTGLAVTKLDVLGGMRPLKIGVAYRLDGKMIEEMPQQYRDLERCEPVYEELPGWDEPIGGVREHGKLPAAARRYVERVSELLEVPITLISVGSGPEATIRLG